MAFTPFPQHVYHVVHLTRPHPTCGFLRALLLEAPVSQPRDGSLGEVEGTLFVVPAAADALKLELLGTAGGTCRQTAT